MLMIKSLFSPKSVKLHPNGNIHIPRSFKSLLSLCIGMFSIGLHAADTVFVKTPQVPILIERHDNVLAYLRIDAKETKTLDNVTISFDKDVPLSQIKTIKLYYGGTEAPQDRGKTLCTCRVHFQQQSGANPFCQSVLFYKKGRNNTENQYIDTGRKQNLFPGYNFFWISIEMQPTASLHTKICAEVTQVKGDGKIIPTKIQLNKKSYKEWQ